MTNVSKLGDPSAVRSIVDFGFRTAYRLAHWMLRMYWAVRRPHTRGALVAVWNNGELLLVKNSYRRQYTLPGGYVRGSESVQEAGARELREECGITVPASEIRLAYNATKRFEHRDDEVTIVEIELETRPRIAVDNREVVWASFKSLPSVRALPVGPHLREYPRRTGRELILRLAPIFVPVPGLLGVQRFGISNIFPALLAQKYMPRSFSFRSSADSISFREMPFSVKSHLITSSS